MRVIALNPSRSSEFVKRELEQISAGVAERLGLTGADTPSVVYTDPATALILARSQTGQLEFPKDHVNFRMSIYLGRMVQNPLLETAIVLNMDGPKITSKARALRKLNLHRMQSAAPDDLLVQRVEEVLVDEVCRIGVDLNLLLNLRPQRALPVLQYVCGLGLNRAGQILSEGAARQGFTNRSLLSDFLPPSVYRNVSGFLAIRAAHFDPSVLHYGLAKSESQIRWAEPEDYLRFHPLDATYVISIAVFIACP